jgi:hypothetical protein
MEATPISGSYRKPQPADLAAAVRGERQRLANAVLEAVAEELMWCPQAQRGRLERLEDTLTELLGV